MILECASAFHLTIKLVVVGGREPIKLGDRVTQLSGAIPLAMVVVVW